MTRAMLSWVFLFIVLAAPPLGAGNGGWAGYLARNGPDAHVSAMLVHDGALFVAGGFLSMGAAPARRVARFDGTTWSAVGGGVDGRVNVLAEYDGDLVAGGEFQEAGGVAASNIARWDGTAWHPLGEGANSSVHSLAVLNGDLIAGGVFGTAGGVSVGHVARWDGSSWHAMGEGFGGGVGCLCVYRGELYAGYTAYFGEYPDYRMAFVWRWDGSHWAPLTTVPEYDPVDCFPGIISLQVMDDRLYAIGKWMAVDEWHRNLCFWDGAGWHNAPSGWSAGSGHIECEHPAVILPYRDGFLLGGYFWGLGGGVSHSLALYDGSAWTSFPGGGVSEVGASEGGTVGAMAEYRGYVYVAGNFQRVGNLTAPLLARWDGSEWSAVAPGTQGVTGSVTALAPWGDRWVASGSFTLPGEQAATHIAVLDRERWDPIRPELNGSISALTPFGEGTVVAGDFTMAGDLPVGGVASWDGSAWHTLGSGLQGGPVRSLDVYGGELLAGGHFQAAGEKVVEFVAHWDGESWSQFGDRLDGVVNGLEVHDGTLFVLGNFTGNVAWWDGLHWRIAGQDLEGRATRLKSTPIGLFAADNDDDLWRWENGSWSAIGIPAGQIRCLGTHKGDLIVGGRLRLAATADEVGLLRWDGNAWSSVEGGPRRSVYAHATRGFDLAVGGAFTSREIWTTLGMALWQEEQLLPDYPIAPLRFDAARSGSTVELSCEIVHGEEARAYEFYRESAGQGRTLVTGIPLSGHREYRFVDAAAPLCALDYWMEQVLANGDHVAWFGPVHVPSADELWPLRELRVYPSPSSGSVVCAFELPAPVETRVDVIDPAGRVVATLQNGLLGRGAHRFEWDGGLGDGRRLTAGVYWMNLEAGQQTRRTHFVRVQ